MENFIGMAKDIYTYLELMYTYTYVHIYTAFSIYICMYVYMYILKKYQVIAFQMIGKCAGSF